MNQPTRSWRTQLFLAVYLLISLVSTTLALAEVSLKSEVSPRAGSKEDLFLFTVTIEGVRNSPAPTLTDDNDFDVSLLGPRTSIAVVNGVMNSKVSFVYHLTPRREGELRTPKVSVEIDGKILSAVPITVPVAAGGAGNAQRHDLGDLLFLKQTVSPSLVFEGEQVVHTLSVYTRVDLNDLNIEEPTSDGFWQDTIADNQRALRSVNNINYTAVESFKALFPLRSGAITIPARTLKAKIPDERRSAQHGFSFDPFNDDFFRQFFERVEFKPVTVTSNELKLQVKPLPPMPSELAKNAPAVAIVGATSIKMNYPLEAINTGESKTISIEVTSEGNLNTLKSLPIEVPDRFKLYEERPEVKTDRRSGKLVTHKTFKYSVLALSPGLARIPGIKLTFFNPYSGEYEVATTEHIAFPVRGSDLSKAQPSIAAPGHESPSAAIAEIPTLPPIPVAPPLDYEESGLLDTLSKYVSVQMAILILVGVCGIGFVSIWAKQRNQNRVGGPVIDLGEISTIKDIERCTRQVISSRVSGISDGSTMDELRARVSTSITNKDLALSINSLLDDIEISSYGGSHTDSGINDLKDRLSAILGQLNL